MRLSPSEREREGDGECEGKRETHAEIERYCELNQEVTNLTNAAGHNDNNNNHDEDQLVDVQLAEIIRDDNDELYDV